MSKLTGKANMKSLRRVILFCFVFGNAQGQECTDKPKVFQDTTIYNVLLPILGKKVKELGFDLPHSAGISVSYLWQKSKVSTSNVNVGFNNRPLYDVGEFINFNSTTTESTGVNIRPDIWVFPFLRLCFGTRLGILPPAIPVQSVVKV